MTSLLLKLLQQITDRDIASAYGSVIELDRYAKNRIDGAEWMTALVDELAKRENQPLTWTNEKPIAPGWYWWRQPGHDADKDKEIICLWSDGDVWRPNDECTFKIEWLSGQFAGPIPEPIDHSVGGPIDPSRPFIVGNGDAERFYPEAKGGMSMSEKYARMIQTMSFTIDEIKRLLRVGGNRKPTEPKE